ncbi:hypothetical protein FGIG_09026 [Fasciola gigantica]|uniref:Uncharacterized protein n=1 Tax=Fasciola gigantica TaxID=46835 RepID=A0A504YGJ6_FASGI|nr:hypothetical protein FGIG_09026 [Fasciola gigantica]
MMITLGEIESALCGLSQHKDARPDGIRPTILQPLAEVMTPHVEASFDFYIEERKILEDWGAQIVPIYESERRDLTSNYSPVGLLPVLLKNMERCNGMNSPVI